MSTSRSRATKPISQTPSNVEQNINRESTRGAADRDSKDEGPK